jgi:hypothetical protein
MLVANICEINTNAAKLIDAGVARICYVPAGLRYIVSEGVPNLIGERRKLVYFGINRISQGYSSLLSAPVKGDCGSAESYS